MFFFLIYLTAGLGHLKMNISSASALALIALLILSLLLFGECRPKSKEKFTRTPLSACAGCKFVRSPVDYAYVPTDERLHPGPVNADGPHSNPHWMANPKDRLQPLENGGNIDFYRDERKLGTPKMWEQYSNNWVDGNKRTYIENDNKTRTLLREVGDEGARRILDSTPSARHVISPPGSPPLLTDLVLAPGSEYPERYPKYGGVNYFVNDQLGD